MYMNRELIRHHLRRAGPSIIRTGDGKQYRVAHPEFVMIGKHNLVVEQQGGVLDIIDPLHVVSVRPARKSKAKAG
jgi:hypothetical protein